MDNSFKQKKVDIKRLGDRVSDNRLASFTSVQDSCVLNSKAIINHRTIKTILSLDQLTNNYIYIYILYPIIYYIFKMLIAYRAFLNSTCS